MKIALIGYGKMGKAIEQIALLRGHQIVLKIGSQNQDEFTSEHLQKADVCIEFSKPDTAFHNVSKCLQAGIPTLCGTTAWLDKLPEAQAICQAHQSAFLYASNFSIGVNLFFEINKLLSRLMANQLSYTPSIEEIHHTHKKDAPSGTAITLAEQILQYSTHLHHWHNHEDQVEGSLPIHSLRIDPAPGTHRIAWHSPIDSIEITHTAHTREGFASGAVMAAEFLAGKKGIYTMQDVLQLD